jgi:hypothetical protein
MSSLVSKNWIASVALVRKLLALIGLALVATVARAQTASRVDATRLVPGQFVYQTVLEHETNGTPLGTRTVSVSPTSYNGIPSWLLVESRSGDAVPAVDSLIADLGSLRPIHWGSTIARARLSVEFRGDTAFGGTTAPAGRKSLIAPLPPGTLINAPMLETVLRLLPLHTAWEDSATTVSVALNGLTTLPTRIAVIGEDNVRVPAGQFDCWVVSVRAGDVTRGMYWVSKRDPIVVRSALDVPSMGGAQYVSSLVRYSR